MFIRKDDTVAILAGDDKGKRGKVLRILREEGKVLVDVANPLDFSGGFPPTLAVVNDDSLAEQIQRALPEARVVKALNTMTADLMLHPELLSSPSDVFLAGKNVIRAARPHSFGDHL